MEVDDVGSSPPQSTPDYGTAKEELDEKYPNKPQNHSPALPFHSLFQDLFNPLSENRVKKGPTVSRRRLGPHGGQSSSPSEIRRAIIERFISRWRREVGDDIFPAFRLIVPEKDRDRAMYGLKEKVLGRLFVKIMQIDKNSEDGYALLNFKLPGQTAASRMAGDFAGRCFEVISKRPIQVEVGNMNISEVNELLDKLASVPREEHQLPILTEFYKRMNAEELMWLVRIILKQMKVGASERTFFNLWHPDAESLYNVSSSLKRVCWELHNPSIRLESESRGVALMQCFQPQLAQFQMHSFSKMVEKMRPTDQDQEFWIEEKLDGERMQLHMTEDQTVPGGKEFRFWSRKAKDYSYLYGSGLEDENSALTRHLKNAFREGVENIILDGEMITWDPEQDMMLPFGTLKTAALSEQRNPYAGGQRPLFKVFDILYLNHQPLTKYTLRDRRKALERSLVPVHRRLEIHTYKVGTSAEDVEPLLREVVARASEGLVLKNPRSAYHLSERNDDWIKVKPDYMTEFGESLDCLVIGGYYGSGKRGGGLSSFLCGLRVDEKSAKEDKSNPQLFHSFFKVGGGLNANDYATIRHHTEGKWIDWDAKDPPSSYIELGGGNLQYERPDVWIKPEDSVVVEAKAASVGVSDSFRTGLTLRFPRFKRLRGDKDWKSALSVQEFMDLKKNVENEIEHTKELKVDESRKKRRKVDSRSKRPLIVAGYSAKEVNNAEFEGPKGKVFDGLTFFIMTGSTTPEKKSKVELEEMVKANGGKIVQSADLGEDIVCVAERRTVKVASLEKRGEINIVKPLWLFDCIAQSNVDFAKGLKELSLPLEVGRHLYYVVEEQREDFEHHLDEYGDSYARDTGVEELKALMEKMDSIDEPERSTMDDIPELVEVLDEPDGWLFHGTTMYFHSMSQSEDQLNGHHDDGHLSKDPVLDSIKLTAQFAGAKLATDLSDKTITHIIITPSLLNKVTAAVRREALQVLRRTIAESRRKVPRIVASEWVDKSWEAKTRLDEEKFAV